MSGSSGLQSLTWTEEIRCISNLLSDHDIINFQLYGTVYEVYVIEYNFHPGSLLMCRHTKKGKLTMYKTTENTETKIQLIA